MHGKILVTDSVIEATYEQVREGGKYPLVAEAFGISRATSHQWKHLGDKIKRSIEKGDTTLDELSEAERQYVKYYEAIIKAKGELSVELVAKLKTMAMEDPQVLLKLLKTLFPKEYGDTPQEDTVKVDVAVTFTDVADAVRTALAVDETLPDNA